MDLKAQNRTNESWITRQAALPLHHGELVQKRCERYLTENTKIDDSSVAKNYLI